MATILNVYNAYALSQEYVGITTMLSMVQSGNFTLTATVQTPGQPASATSAQVTVAQATLTTLLQNRQTALANQLAAMGITST